MLKNKISRNPLSTLAVSPDDLKTLVELAKKELHDITIKTRDLSKKAVDKFKENLQHYSNLELGFYAALTVALTVTLKGTSLTLDFGR
jgi:hypothetical protein